MREALVQRVRRLEALQTLDTGGSVGPTSSTYVNVKTFGAVGDGIHDDTTAIQLANAVAAGVGGPGRVFFPPGTYLITATVTPANGVSWEGPSQELAFIKQANAIPAIDITGSSWLRRLSVESAGIPIRFNAHNNDILTPGLQDVSVPRLGATSTGIQFLTDNSHFVYFPVFQNVDVGDSSNLLQGATGVAQSGTSGQAIRLQWFGGLISGLGVGINTSNAATWVVNGVSFNIIVNDGPAQSVTAVNTGTNVFTTAGNHGYVKNQMVTLQHINGVTGIPGGGAAQIVAVPALNQFTIGFVALGGVYTGGGTVQSANGTAIICGPGSEGNTFRNCTLEEPAVEIFAVCQAGSFENYIEFTYDLAPFPSQMVDLAGSNTLAGSEGSGGFTNVYAYPVVYGGVRLQAGVVTLPVLAADAATTNILIQGQSPFPNSVANPNPGSVEANYPDPNAGGAQGHFLVTRGGSRIPIGSMYDNGAGVGFIGMGQTYGADTGGHKWHLRGVNNRANVQAPDAGGTVAFSVAEVDYIDLTAATATISSQLALANQTTQTTIGPAGVASALPATPQAYYVINIDGAGYGIPLYRLV